MLLHVVVQILVQGAIRDERDEMMKTRVPTNDNEKANKTHGEGDFCSFWGGGEWWPQWAGRPCPVKYRMTKGRVEGTRRQNRLRYCWGALASPRCTCIQCSVRLTLTATRHNLSADLDGQDPDDCGCLGGQKYGVEERNSVKRFGEVLSIRRRPHYYGKYRSSVVDLTSYLPQFVSEHLAPNLSIAKFSTPIPSTHPECMSRASFTTTTG